MNWQPYIHSDPTLTPEMLRAVFAFASETMREEHIYAMPVAAGVA